MATYAEKLLDARWLEVRQKVIERDRGRCCECDTTSRLQVHHLAYSGGRDPWEYDLHELLTLCDACHERAEQDRYELLVDWGRLRRLDRLAVMRHAHCLLPKRPEVVYVRQEPKVSDGEIDLVTLIAQKRKEQGIVVPDMPEKLPVMEVLKHGR